MLVEDLIEKLQKLPKGSTIGTLDIDDRRLNIGVCIADNKETIFNSMGEEISIEDIEKSRLSNKDKISDYYII